MNRFDRILSLLVGLLSREALTAEALAIEHGVSVRTIYRDLRSLSEAGVPLVNTPGPGGGLGLVPGWTLDRHLLKPHELDRLRDTLAEVARVWPDEAARSAHRKLEGLAQGTRGPEVLHLDLDPWSSDGSEAALLGRLGDACRNLRVLEFDYLDGQGLGSHRTVEPHTLVWRAGRWYLFAWCQGRGDFRLFRLSGIRGLTPTAQRFKRRPGTYSNTLKTPEAQGPRSEVTVRFSAAKAHLAPRAPGSSSVDDQGRRTVTLLLRPEEAMAYCAGWGADLEVLAPASLREEFRRQALALVALYPPEKP